MYAPAIDSVDWTVLKTDGQPVTTCRGADTSSGLITGFTPILLPSQNTDGTTSLAPNNVVTAWYWIYGDPARPVPERDLKAAWLEDGQYPAEVVSVFDTNGDGALSSQELVIDTTQKQDAIAGRLKALGLDNPRIAGEAQPYSISHDIAAGDYATRECSTCHTGDSRVGQPMALSSRIPGDVIPTLNTDIPNAHISRGPDGLMLSVDHIAPVGGSSGIYVFGHDSVWWIDWLGIALFLGTLLSVFAHGGLRVISARRMAAKAHTAGTEPVYMYGVYERLWHWLQTAAILLLIFTGLIIHKPDKFGVFTFETVVQVHNIVAALLVINALLSLFYHLASGEIRQYLPRPYGFFDDTIVQARYYLQGIFRGDPHPFEKTLRQKMNPLQQITYFGILNVLLPLQVLSGLLMWGAQQWPEIASRFGGLPWLAPAHTLIAWLFATFVVMHVYLTTTGHTPLANIRAMMLGWDDVEVHPHTTQGGASS
jgi:thiosulfate reductase cytochrome b subunit